MNIKHKSNQDSRIAEIVQSIRREWMTYKEKFKAIQKQAERLIVADGRLKTLIRCAHCRGLFDRQAIEVNHRNPVGGLKSSASIDIAAYRRKMFCKAAELEALCVSCHRRFTAQTRKRKENANDEFCPQTCTC
jgi:hypothetical protein